MLDWEDPARRCETTIEELVDAITEFESMLETMFDLHLGLVTITLAEYEMLPAVFLELWREFKLEIRRHEKPRH